MSGPFGFGLFTDPFFSSPFDDFFVDPFYGHGNGNQRRRHANHHHDQQRLTQAQQGQQQGQGQAQLQATNDYQGQLQRRGGDNYLDSWTLRGLNSIRMDIHEDKDKFVIDAEIPGMDKEDLRLDVNDGYLTISGEKKSSKKEEDKATRAVRIERSYGHVSRSIPLPKNVDESKIQAKHHDGGMLQITLPKTEQDKKNQITIQ